VWANTLRSHVRLFPRMLVACNSQARMQKCVHLAQGTQMSINSVSKACGFMDSNIELCSSRENKVKLLSARIGIHVAGRADAQSIYLSALICCYVLSGLPEELAEQRARFKLMEFRGSEDNFLAVAVVAYRLTFERVFGHLPHGPVADATAVGSKHAVSSPPGPCDSASGGLPLKQVKKHECPLDDLDDANAAGVKVSRRRVRWLDLEKSAGVDAALPDRMQADRANIASVCEQAPSVAGGGEAGLCARWLQEVCAGTCRLFRRFPLNSWWVSPTPNSTTFCQRCQINPKPAKRRTKFPKWLCGGCCKQLWIELLLLTMICPSCVDTGMPQQTSRAARVKKQLRRTAEVF
jgi:hypothetical protein